MLKQIVVTADDLGLDESINRGIFAAHRDGVVTAASLLMNAPATPSALTQLAHYPNLEVGLHLSLVEAWLLDPSNHSLRSKYRYLGDQPCLHRDWKDFIRQLAIGRIMFSQLESELRQQFILFKRERGEIPFVNSTQHLHLLPGIIEMVADLCIEFGAPVLRIPRADPVRRRISRRSVIGVVLHILSRNAMSVCRRRGLSFLDGSFGFSMSGKLNTQFVQALISSLPSGRFELMCHPGEDCPSLRHALPKSYGNFDWMGELGALTSSQMKSIFDPALIEMTNFTKALRIASSEAMWSASNAVPAEVN